MLPKDVDGNVNHASHIAAAAGVTGRSGTTAVSAAATTAGQEFVGFWRDFDDPPRQQTPPQCQRR